MKRCFAWILPLVMSGALTAQAAVVDGVSFPTSFSTGGKTLALNGAGLMRWKWVIKAYVAALYLGAGAAAADVFEDVPKRLEIEYFHPIEAEAFVNVTVERVRLNVSPEDFERLGPRIDQLSRLYLDVSPGDRYALTYIPGSGTELSLNGRALGTVPGADLSRALFSIWLGQAPVDDALKQSLLGR
jgi:hypothetical protein